MHVLASLGLLLGVACGSRARPTNLLIVVLDTTRADAISLYGAGSAQTPVFDALARTGVWFRNARTTSAWTLPSHASLFTGLYPSRHGADSELPILDERLETLAEVLAPVYDTAGFSENPHVSRGRGFAQGFAHYEETWRHPGDEPPTVQRFADWLGHRDRSRPFFAFVNLMTPHLPYAPPPEYASRYFTDGTTAALARRYEKVGEREARLFMSGALQFTARDLEMLRSLYLADVAYGDARLGELFDGLREDGEFDRTLVVATSDHGENIGEHRLMEHQLCLYETLLRVPLALRLPGVFDGGVERDGPVQLVDVMPTVLEALGVPEGRRPPMEGLSLVVTDPPADRPVFAQYMRPVGQRLLFAMVNPAFDFAPFDRRLRSIQVGDLKLIASDRGEHELYALASDPQEAHDVAAQRSADVDALYALLPDFPPDRVLRVGENALIDEETARALRKLGYLN